MRVNRIMERLLVAVSLAALLIAPAAYAQKGKPAPAPTNIPLNTDFATGYSITGDGQIYSDAYQNVRAEITYSNFYLDTNENKGDGLRRVNISFAGAGSCTPAPGIPCPQGGALDVYIATKYGADLAQLGLGQSTQKRMAINWAEGAYSYHLRHNGDIPDNNGNIDYRHGSLTFTCTAVTAVTAVEGGEECYTWTAAPTLGSDGTVGLYGNPTKGNASEVFLGSLTMPFAITMTRKK